MIGIIPVIYYMEDAVGTTRTIAYIPFALIIHPFPLP